MGDVDEEAAIESQEVYDKLNTLSDPHELKRITLCYFDYLLAYRRDMPGVEQFVANELSGLASTRYIMQLEDDHPFRQIVAIAGELSLLDDQERIVVWRRIASKINALV